MKIIKWVLFSLFSISLCTGCPLTRTAVVPDTAQSSQLVTSYGYYPIDPLPVYFYKDNKIYDGTVENKTILNLLPDETIRIAVGEFQANGNISYGPVKSGVKGNSYIVILDYMKYNTDFIAVIQETNKENKITYKISQTQEEGIRIPIYYGIGLRLIANITVTEGSVDLGNLIALSAATQAKRALGTIVVQTLGISGENISSLIPMPSEINPTTIQNAILSLGSIKAKLYAEGTQIRPRVVGIYNNLPNARDALTNIISIIAKQGIFMYLPNNPSAIVE